MNFILYIKGTEQQNFSYVNTFLEAIEVKKMNADFLDIDNFSSIELIESAYKALEESKKCCVLFTVETTFELTHFYKIIYYLIDNPSKCLIFLNGTHPALEKILRSEPGIFNLNTPAHEIQNLIVSFLK